MSEGLSNVVSRKQIYKEICGTSFTLQTGVLHDHAEKEQYILSLGSSPIEAILNLPSTVPARIRKSLEETAIQQASKPRFVTLADETDFDNSLHGIAYWLWRALRDSSPFFGAPKDGLEIRYKTPNGGKQFTLTPGEGVQRALDLIEAFGSHRLSELTTIRDEVEMEAELGNSSGSETSQTTQNQGDDSPGLKSSES